MPVSLQTIASVVLLTLGVGCAADVGTEVELPPLSGKADGSFDSGSEEGLAERFDRVLLPYYMDEVQPGWFRADDGLNLHYIRMPPLAGVDEVARLVLLSGRTESHCKYIEVLHDLRHLRAAGVTIYMLDHRGQGFSDRMLEDREAGYVGEFQDYVDDAAAFIDTIVRFDGEPVPLLGMAHSMGGAVLAMYAIQNPETFDAIVLSSPMLQVDFGEEYTEEEAYWVAWAAPATSYAVGQGPYETGSPFEGNDLTTSRARFRFTQFIFEVAYPEARLGGPTFGWVEQSVEGPRWIRERAAQLTTPTMLLQALDDTIVVPAAQTAFCAEAPNCELVSFPGAQHELLMETDEIRSRALSTALEFLFPTRR